MLTVLFTAPKSRPAHLAPTIFTFPDPRDGRYRQAKAVLNSTYQPRQTKTSRALEPYFNVRSGSCVTSIADRCRSVESRLDERRDGRDETLTYMARSCNVSHSTI